MPSTSLHTLKSTQYYWHAVLASDGITPSSARHCSQCTYDMQSMARSTFNCPSMFSVWDEGSRQRTWFRNACCCSQRLFKAPLLSPSHSARNTPSCSTTLPPQTPTAPPFTLNPPPPFLLMYSSQLLTSSLCFIPLSQRGHSPHLHLTRHKLLHLLVGSQSAV